MKKNITTFFTALLTCVLLVSCNIEEYDDTKKPFVAGEVEKPVTITQVIIKDPNFSILESLMRRVEAANANNPSFRILSLLNLPGANTYFAPNDNTFRAWMSANGILEENLSKLPIAYVTNLVMYQLMSGKFLAADFSTGFVPTQATRGTGANAVFLSMYVDAANGVLLNGQVKVTSSNLDVNNGVLHTVDGVLNVPTVNDWIKMMPQFSSFAAAVNHADGATTTPVIANALSSATNSVTVFVPNNAAYTSLYTELRISGITALTPAQVTNICRTTIVSTATTTPAISSSLFVSRSNTKLQTFLAGAAGQVNFDGKNPARRIIIDPRRRTSNIIPVLDIQGSNGVIHTLDRVLLPVTL